jgi:hypothetical protein
MNDGKTQQSVEFPAAVDPGAVIERLTRQRNEAWRALDKIEGQVTSDRPSLRLVAFALACGHDASSAGEYNAVVNAEEE